jgi:hypothetical protein
LNAKVAKKYDFESYWQYVELIFNIQHISTVFGNRIKFDISFQTGFPNVGGVPSRNAFVNNNSPGMNAV